MSADSFFQNLWYKRLSSPLTLVLLPLSWLFRTVVVARRWAFRGGILRSIRVTRPVIVVGNITVGGTGKTPIVLWLADRLRLKGMQPGVIARGYGGRSSHWPCDVTPDSDPSEVGDEAVLLACRFDGIVVAGPDRVAAARRAIERGADVILSDDGLQHYRLARDCELAVVDAHRGFGNHRMLPAGPLREPAGRLDAVDAVLLKTVDTGPSGAGSRRDSEPVPGIPFRLHVTAVRSVATGELRPLEFFRGKTVHAVAGIGHPETFFATLRSAGMAVSGRALPDHAVLAAADLRFEDDAPVLMTEKDAVKCKGFSDPRLWAVAVDAGIAPEQATMLMSMVESRLAAFQPPPANH